MALALTRTSQTRDYVFARDPDVIPGEEHVMTVDGDDREMIRPVMIPRSEAEIVESGKPTVFSIRPLSSGQLANVLHGIHVGAEDQPTGLDLVDLGVTAISGAPDKQTPRETVEACGDSALVRALADAILNESMRGSGSDPFRRCGENRSR